MANRTKAEVRKREHIDFAGLEKMKTAITRFDFQSDSVVRGGCGFDDLDGDGRPEIVTRCSGQNSMVVYDNRGNRLASVPGVHTTASGPKIVRCREDGPVQIVTAGSVYNVRRTP